MHITTHILMANIFYKEITSQMGIELDYLHYVYGNIKPDINPGMMDFPHYLEDNFEDVMKYCDYIMATPMSVKSFSVALGTISHFICDYYCLYHTEPRKKDSLLEHTLYEHFLELHFIKKCILKEVEITNEIFCEQIGDTIKKRYASYEQEKPSFDKDIQYAVNTTLSVLKRVIDLSVSELERTDLGLLNS